MLDPSVINYWFGWLFMVNVGRCTRHGSHSNENTSALWQSLKSHLQWFHFSMLDYPSSPSPKLTVRPQKKAFPEAKDRLPTTIFQGLLVKELSVHPEKNEQEEPARRAPTIDINGVLILQPEELMHMSQDDWYDGRFFATCAIRTPSSLEHMFSRCVSFWLHILIGSFQVRYEPAVCIWHCTKCPCRNIQMTIQSK